MKSIKVVEARIRQSGLVTQQAVVDWGSVADTMAQSFPVGASLFVTIHTHDKTLSVDRFNVLPDGRPDITPLKRLHVLRLPSDPSHQIIIDVVGNVSDIIYAPSGLIDVPKVFDLIPHTGPIEIVTTVKEEQTTVNTMTIR